MKRTIFRLFRSIWHPDEGVAAVEFALLSPILVFLLMLAADFGLAFNTQLRLLAAAGAGAQYIQQNGSSLTSTEFAKFATSVTAVVNNIGGLPTATAVSLAINNTSDASAASGYYCASGSPPIWTAMASPSSSCGANLNAGKFVTLSVSTSFSGIFPTDPIVSSIFSLHETIIVRVS